MLEKKNGVIYLLINLECGKKYLCKFTYDGIPYTFYSAIDAQVSTEYEKVLVTTKLGVNLCYLVGEFDEKSAKSKSIKVTQVIAGVVDCMSLEIERDFFFEKRAIVEKSAKNLNSL